MLVLSKRDIDSSPPTHRTHLLVDGGSSIDTHTTRGATVQECVDDVALGASGAFAITGLLALAAGLVAFFEATVVSCGAWVLTTVAQASVIREVDVRGPDTDVAGGAGATDIATGVIRGVGDGADFVDAHGFVATSCDEAVIGVGAGGHAGRGKDAFAVDTRAPRAADGVGTIGVVFATRGAAIGVHAAVFPAVFAGTTSGGGAVGIVGACDGTDTARADIVDAGGSGTAGRDIALGVGGAGGRADGGVNTGLVDAGGFCTTRRDLAIGVGVAGEGTGGGGAFATDAGEAGATVGRNALYAGGTRGGTAWCWWAGDASTSDAEGFGAASGGIALGAGGATGGTGRWISALSTKATEADGATATSGDLAL